MDEQQRNKRQRLATIDAVKKDENDVKNVVKNDTKQTEDESQNDPNLRKIPLPKTDFEIMMMMR